MERSIGFKERRYIEELRILTRATAIDCVIDEKFDRIIYIIKKGDMGLGILFGNPKLLNAAFSDDLIKQGVNSELIEPEKDRMQAVVLRVVDHRDASVKPIGEVREEIVVALRQARAREAALAAVEVMRNRLREGAGIGDVASDYAVENLGLVTREDARIPKEVRDVAFTLPRPAQGSVSAGSAKLNVGAVFSLGPTFQPRGRIPGPPDFQRGSGIDIEYLGAGSPLVLGGISAPVKYSLRRLEVL